jgi:Tol biopolymer transport system component
VQDIFVRDLQLGLTERVSVDSLGVQGNAGSGESFGPTVTSSISADGRYVAFNSRADNLVAADTNGVMDVFVHDRTTGATIRVSVDSLGGQSDGDSIDPHLTADGHEVFFSSFATNLVASDVNGVQDVFAHDMGTGITSLVSLATNGSPGVDDSWEPSPSADGRWVAFHSYGPGLVPEPADGLHAYLRDRTGSSPTIARYCTPGKSTNGCLATMSAAGVPSATAGSGFTVTVQSVEGQSMGLIYYGLAGPDATPFGGGGSTFCVRHPFQRTGLRSTGGTLGSCNGQLSVDWNRFIALHGSAVGSPFTGGETVWIQAWFRDARAPGASNLSDALWFDVGP